ncbi:MAG: peptide chain release factor N(5)-glutamine methyltransferase [Rubrivivax sp.]|nr:peptide chain release factor N(5)-glutamine methyltransferase [Rubrivivax sp.]
MRIGQALQQARALGVARLDAQGLLTHLLGRPREWLLAHDEEVLTTPQAAELHRLLARRAAGVPLAYLVGEREFHGLMLQVTPAVLVPRPETEVLVEWALERLAEMPCADVVDLGTGSGAIAMALKQAGPAAAIAASDRCARALAVARGNALTHGLDIEFAQGDWWAPWKGRRFDLAVANPPYVAGDDPHLSALVHEPRGALTPEGDGLAALRCIIDGAPEHLRPGAWVLLEHGHDQAEAVRTRLEQRGFTSARTRPDLAGLPRCTGAAWSGAK